MTFCKARLLGAKMIDLLFEEDNAHLFEKLMVQIRKEKFTCQDLGPLRYAAPRGLHMDDETGQVDSGQEGVPEG